MITSDDIKKLARLSAIEVTEQEMEGLLRHLKSVVTYASRVEQLADLQEDLLVVQSTTSMRQDNHYQSDSQAICNQFPARAQHFIVVPRIIEG